MKNKVIAITICILALGIFLISYEGTTKNNHEEEPSTTQVIKATQYNKKTTKKKTTKKKTTKKTTTKKKTTKKKSTKKKSTKKKSTKKQKHSKSECMNFAYNEVINRYHWSENDWNNLVKLWNRESGWNASAVNKRSGACGIPQALPCSKMKSRGSDYKTNCYTQINWGLGYIASRYGTPTKAWNNSQKKGWY